MVDADLDDASEGGDLLSLRSYESSLVKGKRGLSANASETRILKSVKCANGMAGWVRDNAPTEGRHGDGYMLDWGIRV